ncbi:MAG: hypothetical protein PVI40_00735 [Chlamydiota bacterium]
MSSVSKNTVRSISFDAMTYNICNVHPNRCIEAGASLEKYKWGAIRSCI